MPIRSWLRLAEVFVPVLLAATILLAWQADRRDRAQLATQLAAAQQTIAQASANQKDRDAQLTQTLAQLTAQKNSNLSIAQLLQTLPQALHLPQPIAFQSAYGSSVGAGLSPSRDEAHTNNASGLGDVTHTTENPTAVNSLAGNLQQNPTLKGNSPPENTINNPLPKSSPQVTAPDAVIPSADLKPLYDFALDCQACQAKLTAAQADLVDEKNKSTALTQQRDAAIKAAKGGSALRRIARAAKWFALGAAAGAVAAKATR